MMINKISLFFKNIDQWVFEQLEIFKKTSVYEELWDKLESLSEGQGKMFVQVLSGTIVLLPIVVVLIFWLENLNLKKALEVKKQISQTIYDYKRKQAISEPLKSNSVSKVSLSSKEDFIRVLEALSNKKQSFEIDKIEFEKISKSMGRSKVRIKFNNLGTSALVEMSRKLANQYKAKISHLYISKDKILKTLRGEIEVVFYSSIGSPEKEK